MLRFKPPPVDYSPELRWLLLRAFGPADLTFAGPLDDDRVLELAYRYNLAPRLVARADGAQLRAETGTAVARQLPILYLESLSQSRRLIGFLPRLAELAASLRCQPVLLKLAALYADQRIVLGVRPAGDLDVLVPTDQAGPLFNALLCDGFEAPFGRSPANLYHLPALYHRSRGLKVELHTSLRGISIARGREFVTHAALAEVGVLAPAGALARGFLVPASHVQAAYCLVHGLAQHGMLPSTYPMLRMIADLIDLDAAEASGLEMLQCSMPLISRHVSWDEVLACRSLAERLARGDSALFADSSRSLPERVLLDHIIAGCIDSDYTAFLALQADQRAPTRYPAPLRIVRTILHKLLLTRFALDARYGPPRSRWGYLWLRLRRPFDLAFRVAPTMLVRAMRHRRNLAAHARTRDAEPLP